MTQTFDIANFKGKTSPWFWTLVTDSRDYVREEFEFRTQDDATNAYLKAKHRRGTYSATLWQRNTENGTCVKIADYDKGLN